MNTTTLTRDYAGGFLKTLVTIDGVLIGSVAAKGTGRSVRFHVYDDAGALLSGAYLTRKDAIRKLVTLSAKYDAMDAAIARAALKVAQ
jgi:hypothetical protein